MTFSNNSWVVPSAPPLTVLLGIACCSSQALLSNFTPTQLPASLRSNSYERCHSHVIPHRVFWGFLSSRLATSNRWRSCAILSRGCKEAMRQGAKWAVWDMEGRKAESTLVAKMEISCNSQASQPHMPLSPLLPSLSPNSSNLMYPFFLGSNLPSLPQVQYSLEV